MARYSSLIFILLLEAFQTVYCDDLHNLSCSKLNKKTDVKNPADLSKGKEFLRDNGGHSDEKTIEKRRLLFEGGDVDSPGTEEEFESEYSQRRRTNYSESESESESQVSEYQTPYNWQNTATFFIPMASENSGNAQDFRLNQGFVGQQDSTNQNWGKRRDIFETRQQKWNEEENFKQSMESDSRIDVNYNGRGSQMFNENYDNFNAARNEDMYNRRVSMTSQNGGVMKGRNYDDERVGSMHFGGHMRQSSLYDRNQKNYWNQNSCGPEKGVIINFNTECPSTKPLNSQMMRKYVLAPKTTITQPKITPFHIPDTSFITSPKMYYL